MPVLGTARTRQSPIARTDSRNSLPTQMKTAPTLASACIALSLSLSLSAADWPAWRGPSRNGISPEKIADTFPKDGPKQIWKTKVGQGYASMTVANGRLYTLGNLNKGDTATLWCLDAASGKPVWQKEFPSPLAPLMYDGGPNATPVVESGKLYAIIKPGRVLCLDAKTGDVIWDKDVIAELGAESNPWGISAAPYIAGERIILNIGTHGTALDKATGKVLWTTGKVGHSFSTPTLAKIGGEEAVMVFATNHLAAVRLKDGSEIFQHAFGKGYYCHSVDPIVHDGAVFIASSDDGGEQIRFAGGKPESVWHNANMATFLSTAVLIDGHLYGLNGSTFKPQMLELRCVDWKTGEQKWADKGYGQGTLIAADGKLLVLSDKGELSLLKAGTEKPELLARAQILGGQCWTTPALANGRLYARNGAGDLVAVEVGATAVN
jgi:outer membrane protein assembly factor BamB